jgi:hypothetical protein
MDDELKKQLVRSIDLAGFPTVKYVPQSIYQAQLTNEFLEDDEAAKRRKLLRLKLQIHTRVCFTIDLFPAKLHDNGLAASPDMNCLWDCSSGPLFVKRKSSTRTQKVTKSYRKEGCVISPPSDRTQCAVYRNQGKRLLTLGYAMEIARNCPDFCDWRVYWAGEKMDDHRGFT